MNRAETIANLTVAKKRFVKLQEEQEDIYQTLLKNLNRTDEPHMWIWDFIANDGSSIENVMRHLDG